MCVYTLRIDNGIFTLIVNICRKYEDRIIYRIIATNSSFYCFISCYIIDQTHITNGFSIISYL